MISIITVTYNSEKTIEATILSVIRQTEVEFEYIVIDGKSTDNTMAIVEKYGDKISYVLSESDHGMYDAINKGIKIASGNIIGILNSDDIFTHNEVLKNIDMVFNKNPAIDCTISDIQFLKNNKIFRHYSAEKWNLNYFQIGIMPPHPTFYCKKKYFSDFGGYRLDFKIAADFELLLRFLVIHKLKYYYIPDVIVNMSLGGKSTKSIMSNYIIYKEIKKAFSVNNLKVNSLFIFKKLFKRIAELK